MAVTRVYVYKSMFTAMVVLQDAQRGENGRDLMGARIVVEWARGPKVLNVVCIN